MCMQYLHSILGDKKYKIEDIQPTHMKNLEDKVAAFYMVKFLKKHGIQTIQPTKNIKGFIVGWPYGIATEFFNFTKNK